MGISFPVSFAFCFSSFLSYLNLLYISFILWIFCGTVNKESACNTEDLSSYPGLERSPGEGHGNPHTSILLGKSHKQRSLASYSALGCKESDATKQLTLSLSFHRYSYIRLFSMFAFISFGYILRSGKGFPGASDSKESMNLPTMGKG